MSNVVSINSTNNTNKAAVRRAIKNIRLTTDMSLEQRKFVAESILDNVKHFGNQILAMIPLELMTIGDYQRTVTKKLFEIAENWNESLCGVLDVAYDEESGTFLIINGQHRAIGAKYNNVDKLPCAISLNLSTSQQAIRFVESNTVLKKLSHYDTFKANLFVDDNEDTPQSAMDKSINKLFKEFRVVPKKDGDRECAHQFQSVYHARRITNKDGIGALRFILDVVEESGWWTSKHGYGYAVTETLRKMYHKYYGTKEFKKVREVLINFLQSKSYDDVNTEANMLFPTEKHYTQWSKLFAQLVSTKLGKAA